MATAGPAGRPMHIDPSAAMRRARIAANDEPTDACSGLGLVTTRRPRRDTPAAAGGGRRLGGSLGRLAAATDDDGPSGSTVGSLVAALGQGDFLAERLLQQPADLLAHVPATGIGLLIDGRPGLAGEAPAEPEIAALACWLEAETRDGMVTLDRLPRGAPAVGRLLAISVPRRPRDWIIWLRPAAAPAWSPADREAARVLRTAWLEANLRRAESLAEERQAAQSRQAFLMAELDHRLKNILANIQALLRHTRRRATSIEGFARDFEARLHAMATAHDLLHASRWEGARLCRLVAEELAPHAGGTGRGRVGAGGPDLVLRPRAALALSLALHELATNAAKHGALSVPEGRIALRWRRTETGLIMVWEERGGPPAPSPERRGFGLTVIERSLAYELGGSGRLEFRPTGLRCTIRIPTGHLAATAPAAPPAPTA